MEVWRHHLWDPPVTSYRFVFGTIKAPVKDTITASYQFHGTIKVSWTQLNAVRVSGVMKLDAVMVSWTKLDAVRVSGVMKSDAVMVSSIKLDAVMVSGVMKLDAALVSSIKLDAVRVSWNTEEQTPLCLRSPRFTSGNGDLPLGATQCCFLRFSASIDRSMYNIGCRDDDLRKYSLYLICVIIFYMCVLYIKKKL